MTVGNSKNKSICERIMELLEKVKAIKPLVHHITNYVTVNDCANIVLAIGGSPIMADDIEEVEDIVSLSSALVLNMGTLNIRTIESMLAAGKKANQLGIPVVFDPVGAGATPLRNKTAERIISELKLAVIRGNMSEIKSISGLGSNTKGVDASEKDILLSGDLQYGKNIADKLSSRLGCTVAITGPVDIVTKDGKTFFIENGHKMLSMVTGTGCMCTSLIGVYCGVASNYLEAAAAGILTMGMAGEAAYENIEEGNSASSGYGGYDRHGGSGSFRVKLIDFVSQIRENDILERGRIYEK
ncbi:MAG TPA: hydroxyethylthiazole kinase [Clostridiales bacterium]|nr:hydroxyethylthiazole kinase [Clostridiales bacterium]